MTIKAYFLHINQQSLELNFMGYFSQLHWDNVHQTAFDNTKTAIAKDVVVAYLDYLQEFEVYTDSSKFHLGAVITQNNRLLAFFSRKLNKVHEKYRMTKQELPTILETLKEFKGMLWGQRITMYSDHNNIMHHALGFNSDQFTTGD